MLLNLNQAELTLQESTAISESGNTHLFCFKTLNSMRQWTAFTANVGFALNVAFDANAKLLNFTEKVKTARGKCRVNTVTWSFPPFAVKSNSKCLYY